VAAGSIFRYDSFTGSGLLSDHASEIDEYGKTWSDTNSVLTINPGGGFVQNISALTLGTAYVSNVLEDPDVVLTLNADFTSQYGQFVTGNYLMIGARGYKCKVVKGTGSNESAQIELYAGGTLIATSVNIELTRAFYPVVFSVLGTSISATLDGVTASATDSTYTAPSNTFFQIKRSGIRITSLTAQYDSFILPTVMANPIIMATALPGPVGPIEVAVSPIIMTTVLPVPVILKDLFIAADPIMMQTWVWPIEKFYSILAVDAAIGISFSVPVPVVLKDLFIAADPIVLLAAINSSSVAIQVPADSITLSVHVPEPDVQLLLVTVDPITLTAQIGAATVHFIFDAPTGVYKEYHHVLATMGLLTHDTMLMSSEGVPKSWWQAWWDRLWKVIVIIKKNLIFLIKDQRIIIMTRQNNIIELSKPNLVSILNKKFNTLFIGKQNNMIRLGNQDNIIRAGDR